jgi:hypothetical protein
MEFKEITLQDSEASVLELFGRFSEYIAKGDFQPTPPKFLD